MLDAGGVRLALHAIPSDIAEQIAIKQPPEARSETPIKLIFETSDFTATCERLLNLGAITTNDWQEQRRDLLDPEGNVFQIAER